MTRADIAARLGNAGLEIVGSAPQEFREQIRAEIARKGQLVRMSGAKAD